MRENGIKPGVARPCHGETMITHNFSSGSRLGLLFGRKTILPF
jgi:hypothetical protein